MSNNFAANFHLRNGAMVHAINFGADSSQRGRTASFGLMVNYKYDVQMLDDRSRAYVNSKKFHVNPDVSQLARFAQLATAKL